MSNHFSDKNKKPLVSVIIPTIGRPRYITNTVKSVIQNDYKNIQILISDNNTSQSTEEILLSNNIFDKRIDFVVRKSRLEFSEHLNICIKKSQGEYCMILSDDDHISSDYLSNMVNTLQKYKSVVVCVGRQKVISEFDDEIDNKLDTDETIYINSGISFIEESMRKNVNFNVFTYVSLFAKKSKILEAGGFKEYPDGLHSDNYLFFKLCLSGDVAVAPGFLNYRIYNESVGMSTNYKSLISATKLFILDCQKLFNLYTSNKNSNKRILKLLLQQNKQLLLDRYFRVYKSKISKKEKFQYILELIFLNYKIKKLKVINE